MVSNAPELTELKNGLYCVATGMKSMLVLVLTTYLALLSIHTAASSKDTE